MRVSIVTLGCKVSQYDSAQLEMWIRQSGGEIILPCPESQAFVISGCAVTEKAVKEARQISRRFQRLNPGAPIILYGCLGDLIKKLGEGEGFSPAETDDVLQRLGLKKKEKEALFSWHHTRGVIKIQDGCDRYCSFCIVPYLRGKAESKKPDEVLREARELASAGFREIVLTGVHLSTYGMDLEGQANLFTLLESLDKIPQIERIRLSSLEPVDLDGEKIFQLGRISRLCPHLHLPLQSGSDKILTMMNRGYTFNHYLNLIEAARKVWPDLAITTDILVGFPGETEEDFQLTLKAAQIVGFSRIHAFRYSPRPFTKAEKFPEQVDEKTKRERAVQLRLLASQLSYHYQEKYLGRALPVLVEVLSSPFEGEGYTPNYIRVSVKSNKPMTCNTIVPVRISSIAGGCQGEAV